MILQDSTQTLVKIYNIPSIWCETPKSLKLTTKQHQSYMILLIALLGLLEEIKSALLLALMTLKENLILLVVTMKCVRQRRWIIDENLFCYNLKNVENLVVGISKMDPQVSSWFYRAGGSQPVVLEPQGMGKKFRGMREKFQRCSNFSKGPVWGVRQFNNFIAWG